MTSTKRRIQTIRGNLPEPRKSMHEWWHVGRVLLKKKPQNFMSNVSNAAIYLQQPRNAKTLRMVQHNRKNSRPCQSFPCHLQSGQQKEVKHMEQGSTKNMRFAVPQPFLLDVNNSNCSKLEQSSLPTVCRARTAYSGTTPHCYTVGQSCCADVRYASTALHSLMFEDKQGISQNQIKG